MGFRRFLAMLLVTTPRAVVLLVCIGVVGCLCPIYSSAWRSGMDSWQLMKRALSLAYAAEDITALVICVMVMTAPLFGVMAELLDMKKCPPALLHAFPPNRYEASLWPARTMLLALYVMIASGWKAA